MTKFDFTTWFCKVIAMAGMVSAGAWALGNQLAGLFSAVGHVTDFASSLFSFAVYFFVWLFAKAVGAELSCESRETTINVTNRDFNWLLLRCAGFWLFVSSFISGSESLTRFLYFHYANSHIPLGYDMTRLPYVAIGLVQTIIGFLLAFGPRLAQRFRSP